MLYDDSEFILDYRRGLESQSRLQRRKRYASDFFQEELERIGKTLRNLGYSKERVASLIHFGMEMQVTSQKLSEADFKAMKQVESLPFLGAFSDVTDGFLLNIRAIADEIISSRGMAVEKEILNKIDVGFSESIGVLVMTIKDELLESRKHLMEAVEAFASGNKDEASVKTRKAWESCVNFALSRLPRENGLGSLNKKSKYVLDQLGFKDKSKSIAEVKNLYEGRFLHVLSSNDKVEDPELPFYIALTAGFVHLVSSHLGS